MDLSLGYEDRRCYLLISLSLFSGWFFSHFMDFWSQPSYVRAKDVINLHIEEYKSRSKDPPPEVETLFDLNRLPKEIRLLVWEAALQGPRAVVLRSPYAAKSWKDRLSRQKGPPPRPTWGTTTPVPAILHVNQEARRVGLRHYELGLACGEYAPTIYVNYQVDWIMLGRDEMKYDCAKLWSTMHDLEKIEGLIVSYYGFEGFLARLNFLRVSRRFHVLENIFIVRSIHIERSRLPSAAAENIADWIVDTFGNFGIAWLRVMKEHCRLELHWTNAKRERSMAYYNLLPDRRGRSLIPMIDSPRIPIGVVD